jgi:hypothetical protein
VLPSKYHVYVSDPETVKLKLATPILESGTAKPNNVVPMGRSVKVSTTIQLVRIGLVKSVDCEYGTRMDRFAFAPATRPAAQVGIIVVHQYTTKKKLKYPHNISRYICVYVSDFFFSAG